MRGPVVTVIMPVRGRTVAFERLTRAPECPFAITDDLIDGTGTQAEDLQGSGRRVGIVAAQQTYFCVYSCVYGAVERVCAG